MLGEVVGSEVATVDIGVEVILVGHRAGEGIDGTGLGVKDLVVVLYGGEMNHGGNGGKGKMRNGEWEGDKRKEGNEIEISKQQRDLAR
jgi:hypothetical protein